MNLGEYVYTIVLNDKEFKKGMKDTNAYLKTFAESTTAVGKSLSKNLTLPILAAGGAAVKLAADFEVASRKFATAFKGAEKSASSAVENLSDNFGLASSQATELLAFTGDLLKGFGATSEEALDLAENTNELAAALAAYNGVPVAQASKAITSALLGETEQMKSLGVVIKQTDVQQQLLRDGTADLEGQELLLAKAQATLTLAVQQSGDAVGSFTENQETLAFQSAALLADLKDLGVEMGTILLPIVKDLVDGIRTGVEWFSDLDDRVKKNIVIMAGIAAAIGPVLIGIGQLTTAVRLAGIAFNSALGPAGLLLTAVIAIGVALSEMRLGKIQEEYADLAADTGVATEDMKEFAKSVGRVQASLAQFGLGNTLSDVQDKVKGLAERFNLTEEQVYKIVEGSEYLRDSQRGVLLEAKKLHDQYLAGVEDAVTRINVEDIINQKIEEHNANLEETKETTEEILTTDEERLEAAQRLAESQRRYFEAQDKIQSVLESERTAYEEIQAQIDEINSTDYLDMQEDKQEALDILHERQMQILVDEQTAKEQVYKEEAAVYKAWLAERKKLDEDAAEAREEAREQEIEEQKEAMEATLMFAGEIFSGIADLYEMGTEIKLNNLDAETQAQIEALQDLGLSDEEYAKEKERIEKEAAKKEYDIKLKSWKAQKALDITATIISTAGAAVNAYKSMAVIPIVGPILGAIAAAAAIAFGAVQIALIASQPAPPKPFAAGGVVQARAGGTIAQIGEAGSDEAVLPLNDKFFKMFREKVIGSTLGSARNTNVNESITIPIYLDGSLIAQNSVEYINNNTPGTQIRNTALVSA